VTHSALYLGSLVHTRRDELAHRKFRYPVFMAAIDLDELPTLDRERRLFSHNRRNLFALHDADYTNGAAGHPGAGGLRAAATALLAEHDLPAPATTRLVTNLRVAGYVFNPVSFFLNYDAAGALVSVIAEVNNTFGGRLRYVLGPANRLPARSEGTARARIGFRHERELYVSPFLHGPRTYEFWFETPLDGDSLAITMHVDTPAGDRIFVAHLAGTRKPLTDRALAAAAIRYPLMTAQVIGLIHLQALRLRLAGVPYRRPGVDHRPLDDARPAQRPIELADR